MVEVWVLLALKLSGGIDEFPVKYPTEAACMTALDNFAQLDGRLPPEISKTGDGKWRGWWCVKRMEVSTSK